MISLIRISFFALLFLLVSGGSAPCADSIEVLRKKPCLIVEAWHDREYVSDLYAYDLEGKLLKRLTDEPLPSCELKAVSPDGKQVVFVANATTFYQLSLPSFSLSAVYSGNVDAVSFTPGNRGVAFAANGFERTSGTFLFCKPVTSGSPLEYAKIRLPEEPWESVFSPDGNQVLLTTWIGDHARIDRCDPVAKTLKPWMGEERRSYFQPTFSPDGRGVAMIREDPAEHGRRIIFKEWPEGSTKTVYRAPNGVDLGNLTFTADGKYLLFQQRGVWARLPLAGGDAEGITGELDHREDGFPLDRPRPSRPSWLPRVVKQRIASIDYAKPDNRLQLVDVYSKESETVPLPPGKLFRAVLVE